MAVSKATINRTHKALTMLCDDLLHNPMYRKMRINSGGCAVFANILATILVKNKIYDFTFRVWPDKHDDENNRINLNNIDTSSFNYAIVENWSVEHDVYFNHVAVEWNGYVWDSSGAKSTMDDVSFMGNLPYLGEIEWGVVSESSKIEWQWNRAFNRRNIPKLRRAVVECFQKFNLNT